MKNNSQIILGLSCFYHDSAAAIVSNGEILAATQEERYTRKKFDSNFPVNAIDACLNITNLNYSDISCVAFYEDPFVKLDRIIEVHSYYSPYKFIKNINDVNNWINTRLSIENLIYKKLPGFTGQIFFSHHHKSHASSAFFPSPYKKAAIVVIDGIGEWSCTTVGYGESNKINLIAEQRFPHSIGLLYSAFTQYLGFKVDSGEYKVMGLAPYGESKYIDIIKNNLVQIENDGSIQINTEYFDFMTGKSMINEKFCNLFKSPIFNPKHKLTQREMDIAKSIQMIVEEIVTKIVTYAIKQSGFRDVAMAGGVALNCVANGKLLKNKIVDSLWVQPAAGDAGGALGAALLANYCHFKLKRTVHVGHDKQKASLLGDVYTFHEIKNSLDLYDFDYIDVNDDSIYDIISVYLEEGKVIGLFHGAMEYGPRALGSRSIIGDPRNHNMQKIINQKIKFRESFRPFAPIVKEDKAKDWFNLYQNDNYMLLTADVKKNRMKKIKPSDQKKKGFEQLDVLRSEIPAVTHVDGSARLQTINAAKHPYLYNILNKFEEKTGCPVLINTSFNIRGEPIVRTPLDALRCFMNTNMDILILDRFVLQKSKQNSQLIEKDYKDFIKND